MKSRRIHIMGASGAGVTTLGRAVADTLAIPHHDTDDYYWRPTAIPFREKRPAADRLRLMKELFLDRRDWVLTGSLIGWGDSLIPLFDLVVYLSATTEVRLKRLRAREAYRFGTDATAQGGWRHQETEKFIEWASHYDDSTREGRNLHHHSIWLETIKCPVLRTDGTRPAKMLVKEILGTLESTKQTPR